MAHETDLSKSSFSDLLSAVVIRQNYKNVILRRWSRAPLRSMAGPSPMPRLRPRGLLSREGRVVSRGEAHLRRVPRPHRVPQLCPAPRRAVRGVGRYERTRTTPLEA